MKKFIAIIAAIAMIATMSVAAFAAPGNLNDENATTGVSQDVTATYVESTGKASQEIHIDVTWTNAEFRFEAADQYWDEDAKAWKDDVNGGQWSDNTAIVDVATRSSCPTNVTVAYAKAANGIAATFDKTSAALVAADAVEGTKAATFTLTVDDGQTLAATTTAGTITVKVAAA